MNPSTDLISRQQAWGSTEMMAVAAFRYCLGRRTGAVRECAEWLVNVWSILSPQNREVIQRDLEKAFEEDDVARADDSRLKPLGDNCDREDWEKVRALWSGVSQQEGE